MTNRILYNIVKHGDGSFVSFLKYKERIKMADTVLLVIDLQSW